MSARDEGASGKGETERKAQRRARGIRTRCRPRHSRRWQRDGGVVDVVTDDGGDLRERWTVGREEKRETTDRKRERRAAEAVEGWRRDDGGVNTPVISLKCTWVQPRAEARCYRRAALEEEKDIERELKELYRARNRIIHE